MENGASSGVYGRKGMIGALRRDCEHLGKFNLCSMILCIDGWRRMCLRC
jgi:hypothetical protein